MAAAVTAVAAAAGVAILAGCAPTGQAAPGQAAPSAGRADATPGPTGFGPSTQADPPPSAADPRQLASLGLDSGGVGDSQRQVLERFLETGDLLEADWKQANADNVACMEELGHRTSTVYEGATAVESMTDMGGTQAEAIQRASDSEACATRHSRYVNAVYAALRGDAAADAIGQADDAIRLCYIDKGIITEEVTAQRWQLDQDDYLRMADDNPEAAACLTAGAQITEG
ncbi:MAG: hypothetical protein LBG60_03455 [Bifidobacteriaceae bacterium]|jgi:hypothetical protein|nr:hypothetical protein [Bifidobacteriaceae bacterium]